MKFSNKCPKCESNDIYTDEGITKQGVRTAIGISSWTRLYFDMYICSNCGFTEEYVREEDLQDSKKMEKLKENWKKKNTGL